MNSKLNKGITLIALVITIIVLLILAGVTIFMVLGDDAIIGKATNAKDIQEKEEELERVKLAVLSAVTAGEGKVDLTENSEETNSVHKALKEAFKSDSKKPTYKKGKITLSDGQKYIVSQNGTITISNAKWECTDNQEEGTEGHGKISEGDLIIYKEKTTEQFYVIKVTGDNVAMLAAKNINTTGTLEQNASALRTAFSKTNYWSSKVNYPIDLNEYTYKTDAEKTSMGVVTTDAIEIARAYGDTFAVKGRLMTLEEVEDLEGSRTGNSTSGCPSFINTQNFWLGSASDGGRVWYVNGKGSTLDYYAFDNVKFFGVRPVIEVLTSSIEI